MKESNLIYPMKVGPGPELQILKFKLSLIGYAFGERDFIRGFSYDAGFALVLRIKCPNFDEIKLLSKF